jgi:hypothetical protein
LVAGAKVAAMADKDDKAEQDKKAAEKMERIKKGLLEAKRKQQAEESVAKKPKTADDLLDSLYGGLPEPDPDKDEAFAAKVQRMHEEKSWHKFRKLPSDDTTKAIFLDVDGVLRPLTAGGFRAMMVDGEWALKSETADFISGAMLALRHIVEETGAMMILSSEWRRDEPMRAGVDSILKDYEMMPCHSWTPTDLQRDMGTENPFQAFTERRAREISMFLSKNPQVRQWVVLDDINMADADNDRKPGTLRMTERIVQTHRKQGLTLENAKAAVKILQGEKLPPQVLKVQPHVELI